KGKLPEYMVPSQYLSVESFPLTPNGKIDRKAFPVPSEFNFDTVKKEVLLPTNEMEDRIARVWQDLLKIPKVGINDNFFDIGGHSLLAVQLHAKLKEAIDSELSLTDIFRFSTIKAISEFIENKKSNLFEIASNLGSKRAEMSKLRISRSKKQKKN
ncbi:MAG TPA: phosphopantetheine-binding protein, partial [Ignavibacteriaceae bacterium]|nr:phosphopantetheine-binding protein [Ignavibacteriaceae bacterium]